eukprot:gene2934-3201_t
MKGSATLPLIPSSDSQGKESSTKRANDQSYSTAYLPPLSPALTASSAVVRTQFVQPEKSAIVQTSSSGDDQQLVDESLPLQWTKQQLEFSENVQRSKIGWENEIARHILSLYASTTATKNIKESNSLLDFVGEREKSDDTAKHHYHHDIQTHVPLFQRPTEPKPLTVDQTNNTNTQSDYSYEDIDESVLPQKQKTIQKKKKKRKSHNNSNRIINGKKTLSNEEEKQNQEKSQLIEEILSKIDSYTDKAVEKDAFRITNTIRTKDGVDVIVRGSPRCFPIWFTSTGDVYANWTKLPGKRHLQAHLSTLYEHEYYKEYVKILEVIIVELFRLKMYGKQEFTLTSFGMSSKYTDYSTTLGKKREGSHQASDVEGRQRWIDSVLQEQISQDVRSDLNRYMSSEHQLENVLVRTGTTRSAFSTGTGTLSTTELLTQQENQELSIEDIVALYQQLILTTLAIVVLCIEKKKFELAITFINQAEQFSGNVEILTQARLRKYYKGYVHDAMAYYFYRRKKLLAAKEYSERSIVIFEKVGDYEGVGGCLLHIAAVLCGLGQFKESHRMLYQFLAMVESGRLSTASASPKQLCMVSVAYHNLAVVQLKLDCSDLACKNSQNARKIARLCLSYSNRYIDTFQHTHQVAISDMKYDLSHRTVGEFTKEQLLVIKELSEALFAIDTEVFKQTGEDSMVGLKL